MLDMLDAEALELTIVPLACKYCLRGGDSATLLAVAGHFGRLCHGVSSHLTDDQRKYFVDFYRKLCRIGAPKKGGRMDGGGGRGAYMSDDDDFGRSEHDHELEECRRRAAYNLPALAVFVGAKSFRAELGASLAALCADQCASVRATVGAGLHEVARILGGGAAGAVTLLPELATLLNDGQAEVLAGGVLERLGETLEAVGRGKIAPAVDARLYDVVSAVLAADVVVFAGNDWRLQVGHIN